MNGLLDHPAAFGTYTLTLGLVIGGLAFFYLNRGLSSRTWPAVEARVTSARLDEDSDGCFSIDVAYAYDVNGETYVRTENLTVWLPTRENAERLLREHPVGGAVVARYDPTHPTVAVLRPGVPIRVWIWLAIATGIVGVGAGLLTQAYGGG
jgi:hypothetical protein